MAGSLNYVKSNVKEVRADEAFPDTLIAKNDSYDFKAWGDGELPAASGLTKSTDYDGVVFTGRYATYTNADTFYLTEDTDGVFYSSFTDGSIAGEGAGTPNPRGAKIVGNDPLNLKVKAVGGFVKHNGEGGKYQFGRYPAGGIMYNGVWYYSTYLLEWTDRSLDIPNSDWQVLQPFVGFRYSTDKGLSWVDNTNPDNPIFEYAHEKQCVDGASNTFYNEKEILIGAPHFVDFGMNLQNAPTDPITGRKYAYMVAHGADAGSVIAHNSWISGDNIYLIRILMPEGTAAENAVYLNNCENWQYYAGEEAGAPVYKNWSKNNLSEVYANIKPIVHSTGYLGNVSVVYNKVLGKYIMSMSRAMKADQFDTIILESDALDGEYKVVQYLEKFAQVSYFMNIPSKFISSDGKTMWLCYSSNYQGQKANIAGSSYSMCLREIKLVKNDAPQALVYEAESMRLIGDKPNVMENKACSDGLMVGNIYAQDEGVSITNLISSGDTLAFTYAHGGTYVNQATVFVNGVFTGKVRLNPTGNWNKFATALFHGSFNKGDKVDIKLTEDDINQNKLYGAWDESGNYIVDSNYRIFGDIDKITVMTTGDKTINLHGSTQAKMYWGIWDYGEGVAGFRNGNTNEARDTLQTFSVPSSGVYHLTFNYFAGSFPNASTTNRYLNFIVNGKRNLIQMDATSDWSVPLSKSFDVELNEGQNTIILQGEFGPDSCVNADNLQIFDSDSNLVAKLEAEEGTLVNIGIHPGGIVAGFENRCRPTMDLTVNVPASGYYTLLMEYASWEDAGNNGAYRYLDIGANMQGNAKGFSRVRFHRTNDWSHYSTEAVVLYLQSGDNTVSFVGSYGLDSSVNLKSVVVTNEITASTVTLSVEKELIAVGEEIVPVLNTNPIDGIIDNVVFSVTNITGEAVMDASGKITATRKGEVEIKAEVTINSQIVVRTIKVFIGLLHYEAEEAALGGTAYITNVHGGYSGTGFVAGFDQGSGSASVTFTSNVETAGYYNLAIRYSAGPLAGASASVRTIGLYVNNSKTVEELPLTSGWTEWKTEYRYIYLQAGTNSIKISTELNTNDDCINLDYIEVLDVTEKIGVKFVGPSEETLYTEEINVGETATRPADPTVPQGKAFGGWYSDKECTQPFDFDKPLLKHTIVYAKYVDAPNIWDVTLHANGGTSVTKVTDGELLVVSDPQAPEGYEFVGWFIDSSYQYRFNMNTPIEGNMDLYALFKQVEFDKTELNNIIDECDNLNPDDYSEGYEELQEALNNAKAISQKVKATQEEIDQAMIDVLNAKNNLKLKAAPAQNTDAIRNGIIIPTSILAAAAIGFFVVTLILRKKKVA